MRFIDGIGYLDDTQAVSGAEASVAAKKTSKSQFDEILAAESEKLSDSGSTTYNLKEIFAEAAEKYKVPQELLEAIGYHESRFQARVTSSAGAMGIMQLMPGTAKAMGVNDAYNPYENIMGGAKLLGYLYDVYNGDMKLTLAAYSAGTGSVAKYNGVPPYGETQRFISDIYEMLDSGESFVKDGQTVTVVNNKSENNIEKASEISTPVSNKNTVKAAEEAGKNIYVEGSLYKSLMLDDRFTYEEYEMLMEYYTNMLDIIASIGNTEDDDDSDDDGSLVDLFKLSMQQRMNNMASNTNGNIINISTAQVSTTSMSDVAAKYLANSKLF